MTYRRIALVSLVFALLVQAAFIAVYHWHTRGCFCRFTGMPSPRPLPDHLNWLLSISSLPLGRGVIPSELPLPGDFHTLESWAGALLYAGVNAFFWFDAVFLALTGVVLLCRLRVGRRAEGRIPFHLAEPSRVRGRTVAAIPLVLLALGMAKGASMRTEWMTEARRALHASVQAVRTDAADPAGVELSMIVEPAEFRLSDLAGPYVLEEDPSRRTRFLDRFVPPRGWSGLARFGGGARYEFIVYREQGEWHVSLAPPVMSMTVEGIR